MKKSSFFPLYTTNFWGVLNDNFLKSLASFIAVKWVSPVNQPYVLSIAAGALVLPYILFSPLAGRWTQITSKKRILHYAKLFEIPIMFIAILGFHFHSVAIVITSIIIMGLQSAMYSPAKYALIRDVGGIKNVSIGMGGMDGISFIATLFGLLLASYISDNCTPMFYYSLLILFSVLGLISSYTIKADEQYDHVYYPINPRKFLKRIYVKVKTYKDLNAIIISLSWFWWLAATIQIGLIIYCQKNLGMNSFHTGLTMSLATIAIAIGNVTAGYWDKNHNMLKYEIYLSWGISVFTLLIFLLKLSHVQFDIMLFCIAFLAGLFKLPLDAEIQKRVKGPQLNLVLSYFNQVSFLFMFLASVTFAFLSHFFDTRYMFALISIIFLYVPIYLMFNYRPLICYTCRVLFHLRYKVKISGIEHLDEYKSNLIIPNHASMLDPLILFAELHEYQIKPLVDEVYFQIKFSKKILRLLDAVSVPDLRKSRKGIKEARMLEGNTLKALRKGGNVLFYPSGHITLDRFEDIGNRQLTYNVCRKLPKNTGVIGIVSNGYWGSMWSKKDNKKTPPLIRSLFKSFLLIFTVPFRKKRLIEIKLEPIKENIEKWKDLPKREFNANLENYYNSQIKIINKEKV